MIITGIRMSMHDPEALKKGIWVIIGGLLIFLSNNILKLIQSFAGQ
jgi:type IV secretory pathway VirB2 component (pilin)